MKTTTYTVTGQQGSNIRTLPSGESKIEYHFDKGKDVQVVEDFTATNTVGSTTKYLCIYYKQRYLWAVADNFVKKVHVDYHKKVAESAKIVYPRCIGKTHGGKDINKVISLATMEKYDELTCNRIASITAQQAGILDVGQIVSHTAPKKGKKTIKDAVKNYNAFKHCKVVWVNKLYKDLPAEYKKAGCIYYQNSNACISAGNGHIWSCNKSRGYTYKSKGDYYKDSGYPFTSNILVVVIPEN
jgi:hypothetical protein